MRIELITVSGALAPGPGAADAEPRSEEEYIAELNDNAFAISEQIERELRRMMPPGCAVSAGITFRRGSIEFELLIWLVDFTGSLLAKMGAGKMVIAAIDPVLARSVSKVLGVLPFVPTRVRALVKTWADESAKNRTVRIVIGFGWFLAGIIVALAAVYLRRGG